MLEKVKQQGTRASRDYRSSQMQPDYHEKRAQEILKKAGNHFNQSLDVLSRVKRGDWTRAAVGWAVWKETLVSQS